MSPLRRKAMIEIDPLDREFSDLLAMMTREQKHYLCKCLEEFDAGRCTLDQALAKFIDGAPRTDQV